MTADRSYARSADYDGPRIYDRPVPLDVKSPTWMLTLAVIVFVSVPVVYVLAEIVR